VKLAKRITILLRLIGQRKRKLQYNWTHHTVLQVLRQIGKRRIRPLTIWRLTTTIWVVPHS